MIVNVLVCRTDGSQVMEQKEVEYPVEETTSETVTGTEEKTK